ncbi:MULTISPECIES: hypothetical protein [Natrialba]|nr:MULTISPECIES: hypothetical protein [Natrialba]
MKRNRRSLMLALVTMMTLALSVGGVVASDSIDADVSIVGADDAETGSDDEFTIERVDETDFEETSISVIDADTNASTDESIAITTDDETTVLEPPTNDTRTIAADEFDVTTVDGDGADDAGPTATYDIDGTIDPGEGTAYGPHSLAAGESLTVDVSWDAADSDLCLGLMAPDGEIVCAEESNGQGSVTVEVEESGDYYAFVGNEGPYTAAYTGHYRV